MTQSPSENIDRFIVGLAGWRGDLISRLRALIKEAEPALEEDWKWDTPVWSSNGNVCAVGAFKDSVKINFFKGASLPDPQGLFNGGLQTKASRSIDLAENDSIDEGALQDLVRAAAAHNSVKR